MDKKLLEQIDSIRSEIKDLNNRIVSLNNEKIETTTDSVQASSHDFPYIQHTVKIEGYDNIKYIRNTKNRNKYKKQIKSKKYKLEKLINELEYELNKIEDSEIRQILRYRYEDDLSWIQIMYKMNYKSEEKARIKLKRFLKKF